LNLPSPRLSLYLHPELLRQRVDLVNIKIQKGIRTGITLVLGKVEMDGASAEEEVEGQSGGEAMFTLNFKTQPGIPSSGLAGILDVQDGTYFFRHGNVTAGSGVNGVIH
jgi:hypothetical protein